MQSGHDKPDVRSRPMTGGRPREVELAAALVDHELAEGATAFARVYEKTFAEFAPIIGARGVRGIFARASDLVRAECPALATFAVHDEPAEAANGLATCFSAVSRDV